jgi:quinol monooxygenase YgiN
MFMRLVQVKVKPETLAAIPKLYNERIIPVLRQTPGCLFAGLIRSNDRPEESISLTLWDTPEHAEEYERSGLFQKLLHDAKPYLADASEWRIQLSKDLTLEYAPVQEEPVVKSYNVAASSGDPELTPEHTPQMFVRIVSARLQPGKTEEFARLYAGEILPTLRRVPGCRYAFLTEGIENEVLSISIATRSKTPTPMKPVGSLNASLGKYSIPLLNSISGRWHLKDTPAAGYRQAMI